jgi:hypothetical protein
VKNTLVAIAWLVLMIFPCFTMSTRAADSCQPVFDAIKRIVTTPSHSFSSGVVNGKPLSSETIYVQGKTYMSVKGKWMLSPVTPNDVLQREIKSEVNSNATCQLLRNESVDSEPAVVYSLRRQTETEKEDWQMWISKITGRALRSQLDVDYGGALGKGHLSARYEYSNVHPPM